MSRCSGITLEDAMHCESVSVQRIFHRSRLAELYIYSYVAESWKIRWLVGLPATSIKQQATESKGEPKFIIPMSAEQKALRMCFVALS